MTKHIGLDEFMNTPISEFPEEGVITAGLTPKQCGALITGTLVNERENVLGLVEFHKTTHGFRGDVTNVRELRQFVNFHMGRLAESRSLNALARAEQDEEIAVTRARAQSLTPAKAKLISDVSAMAEELDAVVPEAGVVSYIRASQLNFEVDATTEGWWLQMRRRILGIAATETGSEFGPNISRALNGPDEGGTGAEALAEVTGNSLDQFMGGSSSESDA